MQFKKTSYLPSRRAIIVISRLPKGMSVQWSLSFLGCFFVVLVANIPSTQPRRFWKIYPWPSVLTAVSCLSGVSRNITPLVSNLTFKQIAVLSFFSSCFSRTASLGIQTVRLIHYYLVLQLNPTFCISFAEGEHIHSHSTFQQCMTPDSRSFPF